MQDSPQMAWLCVCTAILVVVQWSTQVPMVGAQLQFGFYENRCPQAESIITSVVGGAFQQNPGIAPGLLRLHFHDCFVEGCDGSVLIDGPNSEKAAGPNFSLRGFEVIDAAKQQLEEQCPGVVSCADILAFAARDSVVVSGGPSWDVPAGRLDGRVSLQSEPGHLLPSPTASVAQVTGLFANKGLSQSDMISLSGAHTIGQAHCSSFTNRLYPTIDPTLDSSLAQFLISQCPQFGGNPSTVVNLDQTTPNTFDNQYYRNLLSGRGLLTTDELLSSDPATSSTASLNSFVTTQWQEQFTSAMVALSSVEVKTGPPGSQGEIRRNCRVVNP